MSRIRVDELINQGNSGPTLAVEGLRVPSTKSLVVEGIISLNGDTGLTGQVLSRTTTGVGWTNVPLTDNNTTYTLSTVDGANPATDKVIRLSAGGSGSGFTDVVLVAGNNVSLTRNAGRIIIDSSYTDTNTITRVGSGGQNYTDGDINLVGTGAATISQSGRTFTINVDDENTTYVGESGVTVTADNKIKIGQPVGPTDPVTFQQVTVSGNLIVQGTTTTSNSVTVTTLDKFINLNDVLIPTDAVADGGGIRLKGDQDHTILWNNTDDSWTSSEHFNLASGREYKIDGDEVITSTALGNGVRQSSLESVGVLSAGRWEAQTIDIAYGGTGQTTANNALNAFLPSQAGNASKYLTTDGQDTSWAAIPPTYNGWSIGDNSVTAQVNSNDIVRVIGTGSALVTMDNVQKRLTINADNTTYGLTVENQQQPNRKSIRLTDSTGYAEEIILSAGTGVTLTRTDNIQGTRLEFSVAQDLSTSATPTFTNLTITGGINATTYTGSAAQLEGLTAVPNGIYGSSATIPVISVDPSGRITNISTAPNTGAAGAGGVVAGGNDYSIQYNNNGGFAGSDKIKFEPIQGELRLTGYLVSDNIVSTGATITELQALDYIRFPSKNNSERDVLNVLNGSVIYNNGDNQLQMYQDGQWLPVGGVRNIGDLLDVDLSTPAGDGQILSYSASGGRWVPTTITASGSVQQNSSLFVQNNTTPLGSGNLDFNSATNVLTYTPPDITNFITTEVDPLFTASPASGILLSHITNWTQAYNWGDHSSVGYLQATNTEKANWNEAYSWGNHASAGYLTAEADTLDSVTGRGATTINNITVGQLTAGGLTYPNTNGTIGQVLTSDGAGNVTWQNAATSSGGSGAQQLDQLTDVSLTTPTSGQVLYFNGTNWTNGASSASSSGSTTFLGLTDTPASMGSAGQVLAVNSGGTALEFISAATGGANVTISDNPPTNPNSGDLWWESDAGRLKIRYSNVWVDANPAGGTSSAGGSYTDADVDSHLNRSAATTGQVLSWNGTDYAWVANSSSASGSSTGIQIGTLTQLSNAFGNTNTLKFGGDMTMFHMQDGVHGTSNWIVVDEHNLYIGTKGETGGGNLYTGIITIDVGNDAYTNNSAHVKLGYGGGATGGTRLETTASGISVTGHGTFNGSVLCATDGTHDLGQSSVRWRTLYADSVDTGSLTASGGVTIPTGQTLRIGSSSIFVAATQTIGPNTFTDFLPTGGQDVRHYCNSSNQGIVLKNGGSVELYHNNTKKLETTASGIEVAGTGAFSGPVLIDNYAATAFVVTDTNTNEKFVVDSVNGKVNVGSSAGGASGLYLKHNNFGALNAVELDGATGNILAKGSLTAGGLTYPTTNGTSGQVLTSDGSGNVTWSTVSGSSGSSNATTSEWSITSNGSSDYRFTGPGFDGTENDPTIYLVRGQQYNFTNSMGAHPFQIRTAINGSAYNDGITNNGVSNGTLTWDVQMDAPNVLYYQCTAHQGMVGKIIILNYGNGDNVSVEDFGAVGDGEVDDTTAIQDAINSGAKHLTFPSGTYKLSSTINITSELHVFAKGAKFVQTENSTMFNFNVTSLANVYSLSSNYNIGSDTISLTSTPSSGVIKPGDAIKIVSKAVDRCQRDNGSGSSLYRVGEWAIVKSVSGTTITLTMPLKEVKGVSPISISGVPTAVTIANGGSSYGASGTNVATTGGTGSNLTVDFTSTGGVVDGVTINTAGTDYAVGDIITITGGGGNATFEITSTTNPEESIVNSYDTTYEPKVIVLPRTSMSWVGGELAFEEGHDTAPYWSKPVFKCSGYTNPKFSEIVITRGYQIGISLTGTVHAITKNCSISNLTNNTSQSQYGYGVATAGTFKTFVDGCTFTNTRHGFTTSSRSYEWDSSTTTSEYLGGGRDQSGMVVNCYGDGNDDNSVFDTHMCAQDYVFNNCVVDGAESGFAIRGRNVTVSNCKTFNVNRGILAHTEYAGSATDSDAWANDKNHMTSIRINDCEFNAYNYPMHMKALTSCDITDVVANAGQAVVLFVEGCKVNLHGTNTFAVSDFYGTSTVSPVNDKGMITVTGSGSLASYIDPGIFVSPGSYLRLDGALATSGSNDLSIFHFNSGYSHSIVNDGKISIKLSTAIRYIRNAVDNCTFSGQGELMWESTNKHSSFATNFIGTSTDTTKWAYIDAYEIGDAIRHYWKDKRPKTVFSNVPEKLTHTGTGSKVGDAFILPSQHMRWANQLTGGEVIKQRFNIDQPDNNTSTFEIRFCGGFVHNWTSSAGRQEVEITAIMPAYRTQTIYIRIIEGDQNAGDTNVYAIVKDKTIAGGFGTSSTAREAGALTLDVTAPSGTVITVAPIETTVSRLSINVP